jgi:hypothetical protein
MRCSRHELQAFDTWLRLGFLDGAGGLEAKKDPNMLPTRFRVY